MINKEIHFSIDETPILQISKMGCNEWALPNGKIHRLDGPARIWPKRVFDQLPCIEFWINDYYYVNVFDWLKHHPNQNEEFKQEMIKNYGYY